VFSIAGWASGGDPVKGKDLFKGCAGCHNVDNDQRKMGPSLRTLFGKVTLRNGKRATEENVRQLVLDGWNGMPSFRSFLTDEQANDLMAYLVTLNAKIASDATTAGPDLGFRTWCVNCHDPKKPEKGPDLRGLMKRGKFAKSGDEITESALRHLIDQGHGTAPPLKSWIDESARQSILDYLKNY